MKRGWIYLAVSVAGYMTLALAFMWPPIMWQLVPNPHLCANNLRMIDCAKEQWSLAKRVETGTCAVTEVNWYIKGGTTPVCPSGGTYSYNPIGVLPECSYARKTDYKPKKERVSLFRYVCDDENDPRWHK